MSDRTEGTAAAEPGRAGEAVALAWAVAATAAVSWLLVRIFQLAPEVAARRPKIAAAVTVVTAAAWSSLALLAFAAVWLARRDARGRRRLLADASPFFIVRLTAYAGLASLVAASLAAGRHPGAPAWLVELAFSCTAAPALAALLAVFAARPAWLAAPRRRLGRLGDAIAFNLTVALLLAELAVAGVARFSASPLLHFDRVFASSGSVDHVTSWLRRWRLKPGTRFYDREVNSRGFPDDEPFVAGPRDFVVAVMADSFGLGVVPLSFNFTSVAERRLQAALGPRFERVAVQNFGVPAIGPPEYFYLFMTEAVAFKPSLVVVCFFVGNDLGAPIKLPPSSPLAVQGWRTFQVLARLSKIHEVKAAGGQDFLGWDRFPRAVPPWVNDHRLEPPSFDERSFLEVELQRVENCNVAWPILPDLYGNACEILAAFKGVLHERLLVVLVPDEYQVNDALWATLMQRVANAPSYQREHPQRQVADCCQRHGIGVLDLLPVLREAQRSAPTYHLRDTHWNAYGNRVAGEAIAARIAAQASN